MFGHPTHGHVEIERHLGRAGHAGNRRGIGVMGRCGQRNMAFARQQTRGRVKPDPARAGQINLAPCMQIGEVVIRARRSVERLQIRLQLDQVARAEPRRKAQIAQDLHQQPRTVAAGAGAALQRFLGRLHARLHADGIIDLLRQAHVQSDEEIDGVVFAAIDVAQELGQARACGLRRGIDRQILAQRLGVVEGP